MQKRPYNQYQAQLNIKKCLRENELIQQRIFEDEEIKKDSEILASGRDKWKKFTLQQRIIYVNTYCKLNPLVENFINSGFNFATGDFSDAGTEFVILNELNDSGSERK